METCVFETILGNFSIKYKQDVIYELKKVEKDVSKEIKQPKFVSNVEEKLNEYFKGNIKKLNFKFKLNGTFFQAKVWNELLKIPYGQTRTYKQIATSIGNEKAARAVGMANNKNPIAIIVPCHRVIGANGKLVGYAGGISMKKKLLDLEKANK